MSEIYAIMRCIPICMQGITHGCKHCLCICCCLLRINRLLLASSTEFSATGPQRLAKAVIPTLFLTHLHTFMWKWTEGTVING